MIIRTLSSQVSCFMKGPENQTFDRKLESFNCVGRAACSATYWVHLHASLQSLCYCACRLGPFGSPKRWSSNSSYCVVLAVHVFFSLLWHHSNAWYWGWHSILCRGAHWLFDHLISGESGLYPCSAVLALFSLFMFHAPHSLFLWTSALEDCP